MRPRICVSVMPRSVEEGTALMERAAKKGADLVEIRLDRLNPSSNLKAFSAKKDIPTIATNRQPSQGGEFRGNEEERFGMLSSAAEAGFDYIDLEESIEGPDLRIENIRRSGPKLIISHHDLRSTPSISELEKILLRISKFKPDIYKIVTTATSIQDNLVTLSFLQKASADIKMVCFAMGEHGKVSRVVSPIFGAHFTMASMETGIETAPGQLTIDDLKTIYGRLGLG